MIATKKPRRRMALLASSQLFASSLLIGASGLALIPGVALAANECGDPNFNLFFPDALSCPAATYPTGIDYSAGTNGDMTITLQDGVVTTTGGIVVTGKAGDQIIINRQQVLLNTGDPSITNNAGAGIKITSPDEDVFVLLGDTDAGDTPIKVQGSTNGIDLNNGTGGGLQLTVTNGTVKGTTGDAVKVANTNGDVTVNTQGASLTGGADGIDSITTNSLNLHVDAGVISAVGQGINVDHGGGSTGLLVVTAHGNINSGGDAVNIDTNGSGVAQLYSDVGAVLVSSGDDGVDINASGGGGAYLRMAGTVSGADKGITVLASGGGNVDVETFVVAGQTGIELKVQGGAGDITLKTTNTTTATNGDGVNTNNTTGKTTIETAIVTSAGGTGTAIRAQSTTGDISVKTNGNVVSTNNGILVTSTSGNLTLDQIGFVHADTAGAAVTLTTGGAGNVTADVKGDISGIDGGLIVSIASGYADIDVKSTVAGDSNDGGFGDAINVTSTTGTIDIVTSAAGAISGFSNYGIYAQSTGAGDGGSNKVGDGHITIDVGAAIGSGGNAVNSDGVYARINNGASNGNLTVTDNADLTAALGGLHIEQDGLGSTTIGYGTKANSAQKMTAGVTGIEVQQSSGANIKGITVNVGGTGTGTTEIAAGRAGVLINGSGTGVALANLGDNVKIDPNDWGIFVKNNGDATVIAGANLDIAVDDATDLDNVGFGIYAQSNKAADTAANDPSVEVTVGANAKFVINSDDGAAIAALNGAGGAGTGSVSVATGNGLSVTVTGDGAQGIVAATTLLAADNRGSGAVTVLTGTGAISVDSTVKVNTGNGDIANAIGILAASKGNVVVNTNNAGSGNLNIIVKNDVADTDGAGIGAYSSAGIVTVTQSGTISITGNTDNTGIDVSSFGGAIINTDADQDGVGSITSSGDGIFAEALGATGGITLNSRSTVTADNGDAIHTETIDGNQIITVTGGLDANNAGLSQDGIDATTQRGTLNISTAAGQTVLADFAGIRASVTGSGDGGANLVNDGNIIITGGSVLGTSVNKVATGILASELGAGGAGTISATQNANINASNFGISTINNGTGAVTVNFGTAAGSSLTLTSGNIGINTQSNNVGATGAVNINVGNSGIGAGTTTITATNRGISSTAVGVTNTTVALGDNVKIDPADYGIFIKTGGDATVTTGNATSITVNDTVDKDNVGVGIYAESTRAADLAVGNPSVEVTVGTNAAFSINSNNGQAIRAVNSGNGTGGVSVITGAGLSVDVKGDHASGIVAIADTNGDLAANGAGNINVKTGSGLIKVDGTVDVSGVAGTLGTSNGILGASAGGSVLIDTNQSVADTVISVKSSPGHAQAIGVSAATSGAGTISVTLGGDVSATGVTSARGVSAIGGSGPITITTNADLDLDGEIVSSGLGILAQGTGAITVTTNDDVQADSGDGIVATGGAGNVAVNVNANSNIDADNAGASGKGINATSTTGNVTVTTVTGTNITADSDGIVASSTGIGDGGADLANDGNVSVNASGSVGLGNRVEGRGIAASVTNGASAGRVDVQLASTAQVFSSQAGIQAANNGLGDGNFATVGVNVLTGLNTVVDAAGTSSANSGISASITGATNVNQLVVTVNGSVTGKGASGSPDGINVANAGLGATTITTGSSSTVNGGDDAIQVQVTNAANTKATTITVNGALNANATSGAGWGVNSSTSGTGGITTTISSTGTISGVAANGVVQSDSGTAGDNTVLVNGVIGSSGNLIDFDGVSVTQTNGATTGVVNVTVNGSIFSGDNGVFASNVSKGVNVNVNSGGLVTGGGSSAAGAVVVVQSASGQTSTITTAGTGLIRSNDATLPAQYGAVAISGYFGNVVVNNGGTLRGRVDFSNLTGTNNVTFNNTSSTSWHTTGTSTFSAGNDTLTNTAPGLIATSATTTFAFGADTGAGTKDTFTNQGTLVAGEFAGASNLVLTGLENLNNSGTVVFGSLSGSAPFVSDNETNDRISAATGTKFTGSAGSLFVLDATLGNSTQTTCAAAAVADCLSITGGSVTGVQTLIRVNDTNTQAATYNPTGIVLVDVNGGTSALANFELDTGSEWYASKPVIGPVLDKGLFFYDLVYDGANQRHLLVGVPDVEAFEFSVYGAAAQGLWYDSTQTWFDRQADLRDQIAGRSPDGSARAAVWLKAIGSWTDRDLTQSVTILGTTYTFDVSHEQDTAGLIGGVDFLNLRDGNRAFVLGLQFGYVDSDIRFSSTATRADLNGIVAGLYGTYLSGPLFVDVIVNGNWLQMDADIPSIPGPPTPFTSQGHIDTVGGQIELGYTMALGSSGFWEPLATLSYVSANFRDMSVPGGSVIYDDQVSFRGSLGVRLGANADFQFYKVKLNLTGRVWDEFDGGNSSVISTGTPFAMLDDFSGVFGEVGAGLNVFSNNSGLSAFTNVSVKFDSDYQNTSVTAGFRYQW